MFVRGLFLVVFLCWSLPAVAGEWLQVHSGHTLASLFSIPSPTLRDGAGGERRWSLTLQQSNAFAGGQTDNESLVLDAARTDLRFAGFWPLGHCRHLEGSVAIMSHSGGFLDDAIHRWHQVFGMPQNNRGSAASNQLNIDYQWGEHRLSLVSPQTDVGDLNLAFSWQPGCGALAIRAGLALPTGGADWPVSTGEPKVFVDADSGLYRHRGRWRSRHLVGALVTRDSELLHNDRTAALYGAHVLHYQWREAWRLMFQVDWHTSLFHSNLAELDRLTGQLSSAIQYLSDGGLTVDLGFREDLPPDSAPDFTLFLSVSNTR